MKKNFSIEIGRRVNFNAAEGTVLHRFRYTNTFPDYDTVGNFYVVGFQSSVRVCFEGHLYPVPTPEQQRKAAESKREAQCARKAKRLAKEYGITLERLHDDGLSSENWVFPPSGKFSNYDNEDSSKPIDPFDGDHAAYDWDECLEKVLAYVEELKKLDLTTV